MEHDIEHASKITNDLCEVFWRCHDTVKDLWVTWVANELYTDYPGLWTGAADDDAELLRLAK